MIQQMQTACNECGGRGEVIKEEDKCVECKGKKVNKQKKILEVMIEKGMKHGQKIVFAGEANESPGIQTGDIIFVISEQPHEIFKRKGADLIMEFTIPLIEALTGFSFSLKHLDDRILHVKSAPGEVIKSGDVRCLKDEGMPSHKHRDLKGNLYIKFNVEFPKEGFLGKDDKKKIQQLEALLPPRRPLVKVTNDMEDAILQKFPEGGSSASHAHSYDEDEEESSGGQRVQCAQQ